MEPSIMKECRTISVTIARPPDEVYRYLAEPARFPEWSAFLVAMKPDGANWIGTTPHGEVRIAFSAENRFRILDHDVTTPDGETVHVPLRVIANDTGSEVLFTIFRSPGMTDEAFNDDIAMVQRDLEGLKRRLEGDR